MAAGILGSLIGGGASIFGAMAGAEATSEASEKNWQINLLNYFARERERKDRIKQQTENTRDTKLGSTNARGDRTKFVEGKGWVVDLSDDSEQLDNAQLNEQMMTLLRDKPQEREIRDRNMRRQVDEDFQAEGFREELENVRKQDPTELRRLFQSIASQGVNEAYDAQGNQAMKTAIRTGASNTGNILASLARGRGDALGKANLDAHIKSLDAVESKYDKDRAGLSSLYNMFAERAGRMPNVSYQPQNATAGGDGMLAGLAQSLGVDARALAEAFGAKGGTVDYVQPDMGMANALASIGGVANGIGNQFQQRSDKQSEIDYAMEYLKKGRGGY